MKELKYPDNNNLPNKDNSFLWYEHFARYILAGELVQDKIVLDIGCKTGYGTNYLEHKGAKKVIGIDKSSDAIDYAINRYKSNNVEFHIMDPISMNLQKKSFDVVTAFEIFENIGEHENVILQVKNILKNNGVFLLSTQNKEENLGYVNSFDKKGMNYNEFHDLLENHFKHVKILWQNYFFGIGFTESMSDTFTIDNSLLMNKKPLQYMIGLCSDENLSIDKKFLPIFPNRDDYLVNLTKNHNQTLREFIEKEQYNQVLQYAEITGLFSWMDPEWNYLIGFSLSALKRYGEAIKHFNIALENGFSEFWIKYNRGCIYREMGNIPAAISDLERAFILNPEHDGARKILNDLKNAKWWRDYVGGLWEEIGKLQFDFLVKDGLKPNSFLLDIGCGSLRGGIHFIKYLEPNHYFGIDKTKEILESGKIELKENNLESKNPTLIQMENFDFISLDQQFDYALAQSVFTHLPPKDIKNCLVNIDKVLVRGGRFYATFWENPELKTTPIAQPMKDGPDTITYSDRDPYHYNFKLFESICKEISLKVDYIGDWNHPRNQKIMLFTKL